MAENKEFMEKQVKLNAAKQAALSELQEKEELLEEQQEMFDKTLKEKNKQLQEAADEQKRVQNLLKEL